MQRSQKGERARFGLSSQKRLDILQWRLFSALKYGRCTGADGPIRDSSMGRAKYSESERERIIITFIRATREIVDLEGVESVSIRKVAARAGYNSATMYLYFKDIDELITLASMSYLENYCRTLAADIPQMTTPLDTYIHTWEVFCQYAFTYPNVFYHLFYKPHSASLEETIQRYYTIYPNQLENISGTLYKMLHSGTLENRNRQVLLPLAEAGLIDAANVDVINDLTVCYFRKLLEDKCEQAGALASGRQTERFIAAVHFLLNQ